MAAVMVGAMAWATTAVGAIMAGATTARSILTAPGIMVGGIMVGATTAAGATTMVPGTTVPSTLTAPGTMAGAIMAGVTTVAGATIAVGTAQIGDRLLTATTFHHGHRVPMHQQHRHQPQRRLHHKPTSLYA